MCALFPGEARPVPESDGTGWTITFGPGIPPPPPPVTHAAGYEAFADLAAASGVAPEDLVADVVALGGFMVEHAAALQDDALARSAAVLLGNAVVAQHPSAAWHAAEEPEVGGPGTSMSVLRVVRALRDGDATPAMLGEALAGWDEADRRQQEGDRAQEEVRERAEAASAASRPTASGSAAAPAFVRPPVAFPVVRGEDGAVIPYGSRWVPGGIPDEAYSRVVHPERFAPLPVVAGALVEHLERTYEVEVERRLADGEPVLTLRPAAGAPIRLVLTAFPGVRLRAGLLLDASLPSCGCDACDEDPAAEVERLEQTVLGVVQGGLAELLPGGGPGGTHWLTTPDGSGSGGSNVPPESRDDLVDPGRVLALDGAAWPAWPRRR